MYIQLSDTLRYTLVYILSQTPFVGERHTEAGSEARLPTRFTVGQLSSLSGCAHLTPFGKKVGLSAGHITRFTVGLGKRPSSRVLEGGF